MSRRELDCAVRTAQAALENLFQIVAEEREDVTMYFTDRSGIDFYNGIRVDGNSITVNGWASSSYQC